MTITFNWLKSKLIKRENGIILEKDISTFDVIQDFINHLDCSNKTPVIYYQAFPEEHVVDFLATLKEELAAKQNRPHHASQLSIEDIIEAAQLKMIIIDKCYLHPFDTLKSLLEFAANCNVAIILVGSPAKMAISQVFELPTVARWDSITIGARCQKTSRTN